MVSLDVERNPNNLLRFFKVQTVFRLRFVDVLPLNLCLQKKYPVIFEDSDETISHMALLPSLDSMNLPPFWKESDLAELEGSEVHTHSIRLQFTGGTPRRF